MPEKYTVKEGDTLYSIAKRFDVKPADLISENSDLPDPDKLDIGQVLQLPENALAHYTVVGGDTLYNIARQLGVEPSELISANSDLPNPDSLDIGAVLNLPRSAANPAVENKPPEKAPAQEQETPKSDMSSSTYTVVAGDTLSEIAQRLGTKTSELMAANPDIRNANDIYVGQVLKLSGAVSELSVRGGVPPVIEEQRQKSPARAPISQNTNSVRSTSIAKDVIDNAWASVEGKLRGSFANAATGGLPLVVIDPGHGAYSRSGYLDKGVASKNGLTEVDVVDPVALELRQRMVALGFRVAFTREPGEDYRFSEGDGIGRLGSRAKFAHALEDQTGAPYTVFVSLHANGAENKGAHGMEIQIDNANKGRDGPAQSVESKELAVAVLQHISGFGGLRNRGVKTYNASVLDKMENGDPGYQSPDAAILVEFGFLSNEEDASVLDDMRKNPSEMADRLAAGIVTYVESRGTSPTHDPQNAPTIGI